MDRTLGTIETPDGMKSLVLALNPDAQNACLSDYARRKYVLLCDGEEVGDGRFSSVRNANRQVRYWYANEFWNFKPSKKGE